MRVLVTGAAGFLGGHVARHLLERGWKVATFDREPVGLDVAQRVTGDLVDGEAVERAVRGHDVVCHVAAIGDVYLAGENPSLAASVNVVGSTNVAQAALRHGARVVYASTWEVYGRPRYEPIDEDHPCEPDHPYNITKLAGERMLTSAGELNGLPVIALRLGTAFGTGLRPNSVFRLFIDRAKKGEPITIQGDGAQGRQFTHAADIARAFALAAESDRSGLVLNTVSPETVSIKELAERVVERFPTDLSFGPARPGDVPPALVSSQRIRETLGWRPQVSFEKGLDELIEDADG